MRDGEVAVSGNRDVHQLLPNIAQMLDQATIQWILHHQENRLCNRGQMSLSWDSLHATSVGGILRI